MFEPNLFDYSIYELELPDNQITGFLMRTNKETGEKQEHHFKRGWNTLSDHDFKKLLSMAKKHHITEIIDEDVFTYTLGYINYNQYLGEHPDIEYIEYDELPDEERIKWCIERFHDTEEITRMINTNHKDIEAIIVIRKGDKKITLYSAEYGGIYGVGTDLIKHIKPILDTDEELHISDIANYLIKGKECYCEYALELYPCPMIEFLYEIDLDKRTITATEGNWFDDYDNPQIHDTYTMERIISMMED